jgi:hypothetical protein
MKMKSAPAADPKARVGELQRRTQDARKRAEVAKQEARDAKQRAREARRLFKEAKKVAKQARSDLAALSKKLKKLIDDAALPKKKAVVSEGKAAPAVAVVSEAGTKSGKSKRKGAKPKQAKSASGKSKAAKPRRTQNAATESSGDAPAARRSRPSRKPEPVANGSIEAVVESTRGETSSRTSEESLAVEPAGQNTPVESVS